MDHARARARRTRHRRVGVLPLIDVDPAIAAIGQALGAARLIREHDDGDNALHIAFCMVRLTELDDITHRSSGEATKLLVEEILNRLRGALRPNDIVLQIRDDEFGIVLRGLSNAQHVNLAIAKIERELAAPFEIIDRRVTPTARIGVAVVGRDAIDAREFYERAYAALKSAIEQRVAHVIGSDELRSTMVEDVTLAAEVADAFAAGEFSLYFQPKVGAQFGNVLGAEALVRWHSPQRGVVGPGQFIAVLEESELVKPFTWFVIKTAVAECSRWAASVNVAVNVPPAVLQDPEILQVVRDALAIHGVDGERLTLEVTERSMFADVGVAFETLAELREAGVKVSIDDFGTGHTSLAHFRDLPADEIKIDRTFVVGMAEDPDGPDALIVKAIIDLAHTFSLSVVAEGVETNAASETLMALGCDVLQGYAIAKPLPASDFRRWIGSRLLPAKVPDEPIGTRGSA